METRENPNVDYALPPSDNFGHVYGREHDGTYLKNWNPLLLARELTDGKVVGKDFLGTRVIVYRGSDGAPVVQTAYCPHLGADLSLGELVDGQVRCPYHHWKFAADGQCVEIPGAERITKAARIFNYPAAERWGIIWAFNGEKPLYDLPEMPNVAESDLFYEAFRHGVRPIEGWISSSNTVDFQHLKTVHGIPDAVPKKITFDDYLITVHQESETRTADSLLFGATWLSFHVSYADGTERFFMAGSSQVAPGYSEAFYIIAIRRSEAEAMGEEAARERLAKTAQYVGKLYAEDEPILFSMRLRGRGKSKLVAADAHLSKFFQYVDEYPRAAALDA